jgi:hypothetical protein
MAGRSDIQALVQQAMAADAGGGPFPGPNGLTATLTATPSDDSRLVEVKEGSELVFSSCFSGPGATRPAFYPDDIPFDNRAAASVVWGVESGTLAVWPIPSPEHLKGDLKERVDSFAASLEGTDLMESTDVLLEATPEERRMMIAEFAETATSDLRDRAVALHDLFVGQASALSEDLVEGFIRFHESEGWEQREAQDAATESPSVRATFSRAGRSRTLTVVTAMGSTTVMLKDDRGAS